MATKKKQNSGVGIGGAIVASVAAAAGAYFLYGTKEGAKQRNKVKGWALKAKGEVLEKIENIKDIDESKYKKIVDDVIAKYGKLKNDHEDEIKSIGTELHGYWKHIKKHLPLQVKPKPKPKSRVSKAKKVD